VRWIWFGAVMMALGALIVIFDKRFKRKGHEA
jgi:cytochrome c biogenesis factor